MVTSAGELVALLLSNILQDFMNVMRVYVPPSQIVRRIINTGADIDSGSSSASSPHSHSSHTDSTLGEFKDVITSMVATDAEDYRLADTMKSISATDLFELLKQKGKIIRRGKRFDDVARAKRMEINNSSSNSTSNSNRGDTPATAEGSGAEGDKPLPPRPPLSPSGRQLPSRPSNVNLSSHSTSPPVDISSSTGTDDSSGFRANAVSEYEYTPRVLRDLGRRERLIHFRSGMQQALEKHAKESACEERPYLKTKMMPYVDPLADLSSLLRHPGSLPAVAMNTCEYSGIMND